MLDLAILGLLHEQELHGYEIRRRLRDELGLFANISFGSLYPALSRLEAANAVAVTESTGSHRSEPLLSTGSLSGERAGLRARRAGSPRGTKRSRKVYWITDRAASCSSSYSTPTSRPAPTRPAASGSGWLSPGTSPPRHACALLERRRVQLTRRLGTDRARAAADSLDIYARSLAEHSTEATEHDIAWLDRLIELERQRQSSRSEGRDPAAGAPRQE